MIDIPIGKALVAVESSSPYRCGECLLYSDWSCFTCSSIDRKDGKNVIFKLVDYPAGKALDTNVFYWEK